jgi:hypothetical protein
MLWVKAADATEEAPRSNFSRRIRSYLSDFENHKTQFDAQTGTSIEDFLQGLLKNDDEICMTLLWFLIDPASYLPNIAVSFLKWRIPTVDLEFDHSGCWKEISSSHYFYEGGESKGTYDNCTTPSTLL